MCKFVHFWRRILDISVLNWLDDTAAKYPQKTAFYDDHNSITFSQFDQITKACGTYLSQHIPAGSPVVVMSGRHIFTPAYFLSVVRAGSSKDPRIRPQISL